MFLSAGRSTRLSALTGEMPKPMLPIAGKPLIEHTIRKFAKAGVTEAMINLHHRAEAVPAYFGDGSQFGLRLHYSFEPELLGTAGGLRACRSFFGDEPFYVMYGDNLTTCNLASLAAHHEACGGVGTIALFWRDDVTPHSAVAIEPDTRITGFIEKPRAEEAPSHWISAGLMVFETRIFDSIPDKIPSDLGFDVFPQALAGGEKLYGYYMKGEEGLWWIDTPEHYERTSDLWRDGFPIG
jgi:NDP-sugar pyrophosphorylase family protein